jgi:hypothetical protein
MKETEQVDLSNASAPARSGDGTKRAWGAALYTAIWRWHFWAGLCVTPILLVVTVTGLLYVFKEELEPLIYPQLVQVLPEERSAPIADQIAGAGSTPTAGRLLTIRVGKIRTGPPNCSWNANRPTARKFTAGCM